MHYVIIFPIALIVLVAFILISTKGDSKKPVKKIAPVKPSKKVVDNVIAYGRYTGKF